MKDIMQKLAELEATAPKVTKKKMLNEDSTTPPMNVSNKPASFKDVFENMAMQKPIPVVGKEGDTQQTGAGFLNINDTSPAGQAMQKALTDLAGQGKAQIVMPAQGQQTGQQPQAGATGQQPQAGQLQMKEVDMGQAEKGMRKSTPHTGGYKVVDSSGKVISKHKGQRDAIQAALKNDDYSVKAIKEKKLNELSPELLSRAQHAASDRAAATPGPEYKKDAKRAHKFHGARNDARERDRLKRISADTKAWLDGEKQLDELSPKTLASYTKKASDDLVDRAEDHAYMKSPLSDLGKDGYAKAIARNQAKGLNRQQGIGRAVDKLSGNAKVPANEGAKVDRMVKHIEKSEKKLGKSKGEAEDIAWATANKRGMLDNKNKKKVKEGDIAPTSSIDTRGAGLGAGRSRTTLEGKKPDFLDLDKDGNKKEPMKKAVADKKKQKVKESMNHRISAARLEGKSHGLRGHAHSGKRYEDLDEIKAYHEGYKDGMDELHEMGMYENAPAATVPGMADDAMEEGIRDNLKKAGMAAALGATALGAGGMAKGAYDYHHKEVPGMGMSQSDVDKTFGHDPAAGRKSYFGTNTNEAEFDEGNAFTAALAKTPKGGKFTVGGKTFTDRTSYDTKVDEYAFEAWDRELNNLLNEGTEVNEGLSVSISKGQENSPDSVTITAQDQEAEHLLAFVKNAGLGLFGDDNVDTHSSAMSVQPAHGAADEVGAGGVEIGVVDGHDGMMGLMQKLSGIQSAGGDDYEDEEGSEEQLYGNHQAADKKDCGCDGDCECSDYDQPSNEEACMECGGMMEAGHSCGSKMDEEETPDQEEFEVAEDNAPDSDEAETSADEDAEAKEDAALAGEEEEEVNESIASLIERLTKLAEGSGDKPKHPKHDEKDDKDFDDAEEEVNEAKESTHKKDEKAEKAGKKVAKDIEYDEGHKGKDDNKAEKAGKKVTKDIEYDDKKEKIDEWANNAGPGKTVSDTTFEQDIDFMTKVISGGLNKQKSTGQTTVPVIAGQTDRMSSNPKESVNESVSDWVKLAGIK